MVAPFLFEPSFQADHMLDVVDFFRLDACRKIQAQRRSQLGQFLTPPAVARQMASMLECKQPDIVLLDAGAGVGTLLIPNSGNELVTTNNTNNTNISL